MRIFTTRIELPFASHLTVGSAPGWRQAEWRRTPQSWLSCADKNSYAFAATDRGSPRCNRYRAGAHHTSHPQGTVLGRARLGLRSKVVSEIWTGGDSVTGLSGRFTFSDSPW